MIRPTSALVVALVVVVVVVNSVSAQSPSAGYSRENGYSADPARPGYQAPANTGYRQPPQQQTYGRQPRFFLIPNPASTDKTFDELDKLYSRMFSVQDQLKAVGEYLDALQARTALQKKFLDELTTLTLPGLVATDISQDNQIIEFELHLETLFDDTGLAVAQLSELNSLGNPLQDNLEHARVTFAEHLTLSTVLDFKLGFLASAVKETKATLFQVKDNKFDLVRDDIEKSAELLKGTGDQEKRRMCEVGRVTLDADDRKAEYSYQSIFPVVPQIFSGLCGFRFNVDSKKESSNPYGTRALDPHSIGVSTTAYSSLTTLTLEAFNTGFGESSLVGADVCFMACSIGPGSGPVDH